MLEINVNIPSLEKLTEVLAKLIQNNTNNTVVFSAPQVSPSTVQTAIAQTAHVAQTQAPITPTTQAPVPLPTAAPQMEQPIQTPQPAPAVSPAAPVVPTTPQTYTMDQLGVAATQLMDAGRQGDIVGLLGSFGVQALTQLPKDRYGEFATALRQMGARL